MRLKERLVELRGRRVKIGGGVGTASGYFYCGEAFDGIENLLKELSIDEEARISNLLTKASRIYDERDARWSARVRGADEALAIAKQVVDEKKARISLLKAYTERASRIANKTTNKARRVAAQRLLRKYRSRTETEAFTLSIATKDLQRKESISRTLNTEEAKTRQYRAWKRARDNYRSELNNFKALSETEIMEDRRSIIDPRVRILIIKSSIGGQYWFQEECDDDIKMQWKIRRARGGRDDTV